MRPAGLMPDQACESILAGYGLTHVGDDGSQVYQRYSRGEDGVVYFSGEVCPWHYWVQTASGRFICWPSFGLLTALAQLHCRTIITEPPVELPDERPSE